MGSRELEVKSAGCVVDSDPGTTRSCCCVAVAADGTADELLIEFDTTVAFTLDWFDAENIEPLFPSVC